METIMNKITSSSLASYMCLLFLTLNSTSANANSNEALIQKAKTKAAYDLADPNAAQFRNVFVSTKIPTYVCGEINAKNKLGAYTGFNQFSYNDATGKAKILDPTSKYYESDIIVHGIYCKSSSE